MTLYNPYRRSYIISNLNNKIFNKFKAITRVPCYTCYTLGLYSFYVYLIDNILSL